jgi:hypothetical protein
MVSCRFSYQAGTTEAPIGAGQVVALEGKHPHLGTEAHPPLVAKSHR